MQIFDWEFPRSLSDGDADLVRRLAFSQHGVARPDQLMAAGLTHRQLAHSLDIRRWQEVAGVVVLHNGELSEVQRQEVATRVRVELVALAARTAAAAEGLRDWPAPTLEVLVRKGCTYPALPFDVRVHESRRFVPEDVVARSPARVRIERAVVDAASWCQSERVAGGLLAAAVQQRCTTAPRLGAELDLAGQIRRGRYLRQILDDIEGGARSLSEVNFLRYCRRHKLPAPEMQVVRTDSAGRRRYLDATFRRSGGGVLIVEIDGALHLLPASYWSDMNRGNELTLGGERQLRFPSWMIHADDPRVAEQIRRGIGLSVLGAPSPA